MGRLLLLVLCVALVSAPAQLKERRDPVVEEDTAGLVDEDEDLFISKQYAFNPIQAKREMKVGNFYAKKGNHRAAAARYLEATRWNPNFSEAFWQLGRSRDKLNQANLALEAYEKFVSLDSKGKRAREAKQRIAALQKQIQAATEKEQDFSR